jgi:acyl-CoA synthetase (AMP-forming)/AMP-acid ligase II
MLSEHGDAVAVIAGGRLLSYRELAGRVAELAARLGTGRRLVLLEGANDLGALVAYLAAVTAGHPVLLVPGGRPAHLAALVAAYDPDVVISTDGAWTLDERRPVSAHELHPELALLLSTSGSTGSPKLVRLSQANLQANAESIAEVLSIRRTDRAATTLPLHYCYGLSVVNSHLLRGASLILTDLSVVDTCFWELFREHRGTSFAAVPYTFDLLDRVGFDRMRLPHLRYVTQAGGRLAPDRVRRYAELGQRQGWDLFVMYGQTEATARMACLPPALAVSHPHTIGQPVPRGSFRLEPLDDGDDRDVGELVYAGPNVMMGYAETPADLALGPGPAELRTGDLARRTPDGLYEIVGRRARFAKLFGLRIDLQQVEAVLEQELGLTVCCAGTEDSLVVAVVGDHDGDRLRRLAARASGLPAGAVHVCGVRELPRLPSGKPDYDAVRLLPRNLAQNAAGWAPPTDAAALRLLFAEVLDRPDATEDDTFVGLGGDSLSYVEMSLRLEQALGHLPAGWHTTPLRALLPAERRGRRWGRAVETSVLLRALAIVLVVGTHAQAFRLVGGAHLLVGVAGYNFARFHLTSADRRRRAGKLLASVARIVVPSAAWIAGALWLAGDPGLGPANVLLLNAVLGPDVIGPEWRYWFIEALTYVLLGLLAVLSVRHLDRAERRWPFGSAMVLVALALLIRYDVFGLDGASQRNYTPYGVLWLFALGWATAKATSVRQRLCVTAVIVATVPGFSDNPRRETVVVMGLLLLVWAVHVRCPGPLARLAAVLAGSSLFVYVTHWQVLPYLTDHPRLAVFASVCVGFAYWKLVGGVERTVGAAARRVGYRTGSWSRRTVGSA